MGMISLGRMSLSPYTKPLLQYHIVVTNTVIKRTLAFIIHTRDSVLFARVHDKNESVFYGDEQNIKQPLMNHRKRIGSALNVLIYYQWFGLNLLDYIIKQRFIGISTIHGTRFYVLSILNKKHINGSKYVALLHPGGDVHIIVCSVVAMTTDAFFKKIVCRLNILLRLADLFNYVKNLCVLLPIRSAIYFKCFSTLINYFCISELFIVFTITVKALGRTSCFMKLNRIVDS
ncbi:hypothetical protein BD770DRAFT_407915 [Pilaira anomala]|nr:hypothetical protein BD770DRAFT_407915 [Pilaira anomala]